MIKICITVMVVLLLAGSVSAASIDADYEDLLIDSINESFYPVENWKETTNISWDNTKIIASKGVTIEAPRYFSSCEISPDGMNGGYDNCSAIVILTNNYKTVKKPDHELKAIFKNGKTKDISYEYTKDIETVFFENKIVKSFSNWNPVLDQINVGDVVAVKMSFKKQRWATDSFDFHGKMDASTEIILDPEIGACGTLSVDGGQYSLNQSILGEGTCITVGPNNITFDLKGYTITFANTTGSTFGVINTGKVNVTIKNGTIVQGNFSVNATRGILFTTNANFGTISNIIAIVNNTNSYGIFLFSSSNNILNNNNATAGTYGGIYLTLSSNNNTLNNNNGTAGTFGGIYLLSSSNNTLNNNNGTAGTYSGIYLLSSSNNTLNNNNGTAGTFGGIYLYTSSNNTLNNNNATAGTYGGIYLYSSSNNTLNNNTGKATTAGGGYFEIGSINRMVNNTFYTVSTSSTVEDIYVDRFSRNSTFVNTNWTIPRKIEFKTAGTTEFNHSQNSGTTYVNTNTSVAVTTNRSIYSWTQSNISFAEKFTANTIANYSVSGLTASTQYKLSVNGSNWTRFTTDSIGVYPVFNGTFVSEYSTTVLIVSDAKILPNWAIGLVVAGSAIGISSALYGAYRRRRMGGNLMIIYSWYGGQDRP